MRIEVPLRWGDLDAQGHVNNARFVDYLQDARADFLYGLGIESLLNEGFAVVSNQIEYLAPVFFSEEPLIAEITVADVDEQTVTLACTLFQFDREVAGARTTLSGYDIPSRARQSLPPYAHQAFGSLMEPDQGFREIHWAELTPRAKVSDVRVRWSDLDIYGHVNNAIIFDYIQEGRIQFTAAPLRGSTNNPTTDYLWLIAPQDVSYLAPVTLRKEPYHVRTGISRLGRTSATMSSQVEDPITGTVCARSATVAVFADAQGHPTPITDELKEAFELYFLAP